MSRGPTLAPSGMSAAPGRFEPGFGAVSAFGGERCPGSTRAETAVARLSVHGMVIAFMFCDTALSCTEFTR